MPTTRKLHPDRLGGLLCAALGAISIIEAIRKYPLRISPFVGDHLMLAVLGALLILLGLTLAFTAKPPATPATYPTGRERRSLLLTLLLLALYCILLPLLGYTLSTFLISFGLFHVIGTSKWHISLLYSLLLTAAFYVLFLLLLGMTFPTGLFGF